MTTVLVDSNVILDVTTADPEWHAWSSRALTRCADTAYLAINPIIYAEVSVGFERIEELEQTLAPGFFRRLPLPYEAGFLAGKCYTIYRNRGGAIQSPLPDFYIGAHAAVSNLKLLTRDPRRYRSYFPTIGVIAP
jgi:predicted nucleic acid-binding protein